MKNSRYSESALKEALQIIKRNGLSIRHVARKYGIPKSTLHDKLSGKMPEQIGKTGPKTVLTELEEEKVVQWITSLTKCGFPVKENEIMDTIASVVKEDGRHTPFEDGRPGKKWCYLFLKRHPELARRTTEGISKAKAAVTEKSLRKWFQELQEYLRDLKILKEFLMGMRQILVFVLLQVK